MDLADTLSLQLRAAGIPHEREVRLIPGRRYRTDILVDRLAIEVDGATYSQGRHARGSGIATDCEKQCLIVIHGYTPMRVTGDQVRSGQALLWIEQAHNRHGTPLELPS